MRFASVNTGENRGGGVRGEIHNQSRESRMRCAWALGGATCRWGYTTLLTFPDVPTDGYFAKVKRSILRRWKSRWGEPVCAWVMEIQKRGAPHFHLFHAAESNFGIACAVAARETVGCGKRERVVLRGGVDWWIRDAWLSALHREEDEDARAFCAGGMIEPMRHPDGAGRYVSSEASKPHQKRLPEIYEDGLGRWWWMNPKWRAKQIGTMPVNLDYWPFPTPLKHIWNGEDIALCLGS